MLAKLTHREYLFFIETLHACKLALNLLLLIIGMIVE